MAISDRDVLLSLTEKFDWFQPRWFESDMHPSATNQHWDMEATAWKLIISTIIGYDALGSTGAKIFLPIDRRQK